MIESALLLANQIKEKSRIAIALVLHEGRVLIAKRDSGSHLAGLWEFPGGKIEVGETPAQAAVRECREECGIEVAADKLFDEMDYDYPDRKLHLAFYQCHLVSGDIANCKGRELRWCAAKDLEKYPMPPANAEIIRMLGDTLAAKPTP